MPIKAIGKDLIARGYEVTFITGSTYKNLIENIGATFITLEGRADFTEADIDTVAPERGLTPPGLAQMAYDIEVFFVNSIPDEYATQQKP
jgi:UDP:flavonoid glycosyltransferase YjiC (YdhE family)